MNRLAIVILGLVLGACQPATSDRPLNIEDVEAYNEWLEDQKDKDEEEGFKAQPLYVNGKGEVKAVPDIAVITARISAEDLNESKAFDQVAKTVNAVQSTLKERDIEIGFTSINSRVETDKECRNANQLAWQRNSQIQSDYWFNKRLDDRGDKETKRRENKRRLLQAVCDVTSIEVFTDMVVRVKPASDAGAVLTALSEDGVKNARLYGYDFSDYDALYQEAAAKAVKQAREKAEMIARVAGTQLGDIESFAVQRPTRTGRFGPQPNIVNRTKGGVVSSDDIIVTATRKGGNNYSALQPAPPPPAVFNMTCWDGSFVNDTSQCPAQPAPVVSYGWDGSVSYGAQEYETVTETVVAQEATSELITLPDGQTVERVIPAVTKQVSRRVVKNPASVQPQLNNNALQMSLNSGPQTITVTASLQFDYVTPIDGTIVPEED